MGHNSEFQYWAIQYGLILKNKTEGISNFLLNVMILMGVIWSVKT